jgi:DNA polymerase I-like protein with 3'-5' exonuclease and polymerase domains
MSFDISVPTPIYIDTDEQAQDLLHMTLRKVEEEPGDLIGWDTETTGKKMPFTVGTRAPLDWMSDTITFWSLSFDYRGECYRYCIRGEHLQYFTPLLENPNAWFACWNLKYDAHVAWNCGVDVWNANPVDGLALAGMHDENRHSKGLKVCAKDWCGLAMTKFMDLFPSRDAKGNKIKEFDTSLYDLPIDKVVDYASYDAFCHLKTVQWVRDRLKVTMIDPSYSLWDYYIDMEMAVTKVLWRMERRGMYVDIDYLKAKIPLIDSEVLSIEKEINQLAGKPINIGSPAQLSKFFFGAEDGGGMGLKPVKQTKAGKTSVDRDVLDLLAESGIPIAKNIIRHRIISKTKSTYLTTLISLAEYYQDSRIHPNFNQFGATTGRCSTDVPNSQNFPRADTDEFGIRRAFVAPPGHRLIICDYEQLEMRIMAHMSNDESMIQAIKDGKDLHSFTVSRMVPGVTYEEVVAAKKVKEKKDLTPRQKWLLQLRQDNKAIGFGIIYGAGPPRIAESIEIPEEEVLKRIHRLQVEEETASTYDKKKGRVFSTRVRKALQKNPLLSEENAVIQVARQSIAAEKIQAYFDTFPGVHEYMKQIPEMCRESVVTSELDGSPKERPTQNGTYIRDGHEYDWDLGKWTHHGFEAKIDNPDLDDTNLLTRTGHSQKFGYVKTLCGRYRRLEDINHSNYKYKSEAERQAVNCFDAETEALTQRGWVKGFDLQSDDRFLTKNAETGQLEWNLAVHRWFYPNYQGPMVRLGNGRTFDTLTTPEHRWLVTKKKTKMPAEMRSKQFLMLSEKQSDFAIHLTGNYTQRWSAYTDDFATLVGWVLTDGYFGSTFVGIAQTKTRRRREIEDLLTRMGLTWNCYDPEKGRSAQYKISGYIAPLIKGLFPKKTLTAEFILSLGDTARQALYSSMMAGDGCTLTHMHRFTSGSEVRADMFQFLCVLLGKSTHKKYREYEEPKQNGSKGWWDVYIFRRSTAQTSHRELISDYVGGVWCVTVPNSFAVFRRRGRVFVSGNTTIQGSAADITKGAMLRIEFNSTLNRLGVQLLNQVHDELIMQVPEASAKEALPLVLECMEHPFQEGVDPLQVPIPADGKIASSWAEK